MIVRLLRLLVFAAPPLPTTTLTARSLQAAVAAARPYAPAVTMDAEDLLFLLYTSGARQHTQPPIDREHTCAAAAAVAVAAADAAGGAGGT